LKKNGKPMTVDEIYEELSTEKSGNKRTIKKSLITSLIRSDEIIRIKKGMYSIKNTGS